MIFTEVAAVVASISASCRACKAAGSAEGLAGWCWIAGNYMSRWQVINRTARTACALSRCRTTGCRRNSRSLTSSGRRSTRRCARAPWIGSARIRTFQILRKATNSAECCLFRRFCKISAVFLFRRTVLNTRPRRFDRIFAKGQAASTIFRREYAARGLGARAKASKSRAGGGEAGWCDGSRRAGELTPGSTRVKKPKSWRSACAL